MKEEQAKTKWCPYRSKLVRYNVKEDDAHDFLPVGNCIASDCMIWVSDGTESTNYGKNYCETGHCGLAK